MRSQGSLRVNAWFAGLTLLTSLSSVCEASRPYCGVYAVYGAAKALGVNANLEELIDPKYITSFGGSSIHDLQLAAKHIGVQLVPLRGLGRSTLHTATDPLVLHVSQRGIEGSYTHWLLFLGMNGDRPIIYDGPGGTTECSIESLLARWDGITLAVTLPGKPTKYLGGEISRFVAIVLFAIIGVGAVEYFRPKLDSRKQVTVLLGIAILVAAPLYSIRVSGSSARAARHGIDASLGLVQFPEISCHDLRTLVDTKPPIIIDCRYQVDFARGSIETAISLPIDAGEGEFNRVTESIKNDSPIVLFCHSPKCHFSHIVAAMLAGKGFDDIRILNEGYVGWIQSE